MTDDVLPPESQFEAISRRRQELRLSLGLSPIAPRQVLTTFVGTLTSQFMSMMAGQPQKSPEQHDAQNQAQGNNGGFGGFFQRFRPGILKGTSPPPSADEQKQAEENQKAATAKTEEERLQRRKDLAKGFGLKIGGRD